MVWWLRAGGAPKESKEREQGRAKEESRGGDGVCGGLRWVVGWWSNGWGGVDGSWTVVVSQ